MDAFNKPYLNVFTEMQSVKFEQCGFWSSEPHVIIQRNHFYNETNNTLERYLIITENKIECFNIWNQIYSDETFIKEISSQGFQLLSLYDNIWRQAVYRERRNYMWSVSENIKINFNCMYLSMCLLTGMQAGVLLYHELKLRK